MQFECRIDTGYRGSWRFVLILENITKYEFSHCFGDVFFNIEYGYVK
jgi:hypothetical protein